ncbi:hypothetical protein Q4602_21545 [Paraglaciecola chathamensis]|uniref:hypothetical protein n=1 Tax=Paraglaciecola chathamensis TaxID=368405 RepID=UPI0026F91774|nr:hypothetical protein [Paraglaciecola chathamensis]MDO6842070.1 hypothetical protein [Paraglaciecola chathamensis]
MSWSNYHQEMCSQTSAFQKMPITSAPDGYTNYNNRQIKKFTVNQNVPVEFRAKTHGGLTDYLTDSFYYWSFGDGMRQLGTQGDIEWAKHSYPFKGRYTLTSMVYTEEFYIGINVGGGLSSDFAIGDTPTLGIDRYVSDDAYLEGCDFAEVNVVSNNAPKANFNQYEYSDSSYRKQHRFDGRSSSDPDGNPLTYSWTWNGTTKTGPIVYFSFPTPDFSTEQQTVYLTVTDGDKSNTKSRTVTVTPYCYACNGTQIP